ncbi:ABC transporter permease [Pusillimonas sp.]|uniref:ABC transporter permease n=1 Tax=Pusillimonas sp. TaxID=3040095 RepID=UPI0029B48307|nr:ABC transporter permease subunit [Pusillimonas sp.]MDX3896249.1 ABC transporter permease subunit [Pusillimonas sp.]
MKAATRRVSLQPSSPVATEPSAFSKFCGKWARKLFPFLVLVVLWQALAYTQPSYIFPSLGAILQTIVELAQDGSLWTGTLSTVQSVFIAAIISLVSGALIGFALARYETFTAPLLNFAQTIPYVVWALMSLIWFGLTKTSVVFTIAIASFPLVAFNVAAGLKNVDPLLLGMAQSVRANRYMRLRYIVLPSLTPYLIGASRAMLGMCWKISVLAELFAGGASGGVGYNLYSAWEFSRPTELFAWTIWLVFLMMLSDRIFITPIELFATRWKKS